MSLVKKESLWRVLILFLVWTKIACLQKKSFPHTQNKNVALIGKLWFTRKRGKIFEKINSREKLSNKRSTQVHFEIIVTTSLKTQVKYSLFWGGAFVWIFLSPLMDEVSFATIDAVVEG